MAIFAITFRIKRDGTYDDRYESVNDRIRSLSKDIPWAETTSFYILEYQGSAGELLSAIYLGSDFSEHKDKMVVLNLSAKDQAVKGDIDYPHTLASLLEKR